MGTYSCGADYSHLLQHGAVKGAVERFNHNTWGDDIDDEPGQLFYCGRGENATLGAEISNCYHDEKYYYLLENCRKGLQHGYTLFASTEITSNRAWTMPFMWMLLYFE